MSQRESSRSRAVVAVLAVVVALAAVASPTAALGGDPGFAQQWNLRQIRASEAWPSAAGAGSVVAVIDTGIQRNHEDLAGQVTAAVTCLDTRGDPNRCVVDGADIEGHGTHVAGIAAAASNDRGIAGVAPAAKIVAVRVFKEVEGADGRPDYEAVDSDINAGIRWVIRNVGSKGAINLSLGGNFLVKSVLGAGFSTGLEEAWSAGWVGVLASGNERSVFGLGSSNYGELNALVVGATGPGDTLAGYSSPFGSAKWGLVAPGGDAQPGGGRPPCQNQPERCVLSTYRGDSGREYGYLQGTSMATPHVAGAVALLMGAGLTNSQAVDRLLATANKRVPCGSGCHGRLDTAAATAGLGSGPSGGGQTSPPPTGAPGGTASSGGGGGQATSTTAAGESRQPSTRRSSTTVADPAPTEPPTTDGGSALPTEAIESPASGDALTTEREPEFEGAFGDPSQDPLVAPDEGGLYSAAAAAGVALFATVGWAGAAVVRERRRRVSGTFDASPL